MQTLSSFINGHEVQSVSGETTPITNPSTGEVYAQAPKSGVEDINRAVSAAANAFVGWRDSTPSQRQRALSVAAGIVLRGGDHIGQVVQVLGIFRLECDGPIQVRFRFGMAVQFVERAAGCRASGGRPRARR